MIGNNLVSLGMDVLLEICIFMGCLMRFLTYLEEFVPAYTMSYMLTQKRNWGRIDSLKKQVSIFLASFKGNLILPILCINLSISYKFYLIFFV